MQIDVNKNNTLNMDTKKSAPFQIQGRTLYIYHILSFNEPVLIPAF